MAPKLLCCGLLLQCLADAASKPHIIMHLVDDWGWANAGWHRLNASSTDEVSTPQMDELVQQGIELDRAYSYKMCSPSRCSLQSGRLPVHVNILNNAASAWNPANNDTGFSGIPRSMTGLGSVMRAGNFSTHQVGKWHAGAATPQHIPAGRGYDSSFGYVTGAANDFWDQRVWGGRPEGFVDLWATDRPAWGQNTSCQGRCKPSSSPPADERGGGIDAAYSTGPEEIYEEAMLRDRVLGIIENWTDGDRPLFINYDSHVAHSPLQAPGKTFQHFSFIQNKTGDERDYEHHRQLYTSMVKYLDLCVGAIVKKLKAKGMWTNTLWVCQSDNGGPSFTGDNHTANNWVNAFISGGYLAKVAPQMVGTKLDGLIALADYYSTFAFLAGVDPTDHAAAKAGLPPVDSLNIWHYISGANASSPRTELWADTNVLINGRFKLIKAQTVAKACWHGPLYPNASVYGRPYDSDKGAAKYDNDGNCNRTEVCPNGGCLYDIFSDEGEHVNLSEDPAHASTMASMLARLAALRPTLFNPNRSVSEAGEQLAKKVYFGRYGGFGGPFVFLEED